LKKVNFSLLVLFMTLGLYGLMSFVEVKAQKYEFGGGLGLATYTGDIVRRLDKGNLGIQGTLFGRRNFDNVWTLRAGLSYGRISAADSIYPIDPLAASRNAYFKADVFEIAAVMEYHFLDYLHPYSAYRFSPYGFFGLGYSIISGNGAFNYNGNEDLGDYAVSTPVIPFGIGMKYKVNNNWILGIEMGFRPTFSDLVDRLDSKARFQRDPDTGQVNPANQVGSIYYGNYSDRDWYYFLGLTLSYSITSIKCYAY